MATKLKNLKIKKVDFVDNGANPGASIALYKSKPAEGKTPAVQPKEDTPPEESIFEADCSRHCQEYRRHRCAGSCGR